MAIIKKTYKKKKKNSGEDVAKTELFYTVDGNVNSHFGEQYGG